MLTRALILTQATIAVTGALLIATHHPSTPAAAVRLAPTSSVAAVRVTAPTAQRPRPVARVKPSRARVVAVPVVRARRTLSHVPAPTRPAVP
ncbi:MAG: hypothetical protein ABR549_06645, partial [Mycobacteriales bacterium]